MSGVSLDRAFGRGQSPKPQVGKKKSEGDLPGTQVERVVQRGSSARGFSLIGVDLSPRGRKKSSDSGSSGSTERKVDSVALTHLPRAASLTRMPSHPRTPSYLRPTQASKGHQVAPSRAQSATPPPDDGERVIRRRTPSSRTPISAVFPEVGDEKQGKEVWMRRGIQPVHTPKPVPAARSAASPLVVVKKKPPKIPSNVSSRTATLTKAEARKVLDEFDINELGKDLQEEEETGGELIFPHEKMEREESSERPAAPTHESDSDEEIPSLSYPDRRVSRSVSPVLFGPAKAMEAPRSVSPSLPLASTTHSDSSSSDPVSQIDIPEVPSGTQTVGRQPKKPKAERRPSEAARSIASEVLGSDPVAMSFSEDVRAAMAAAIGGGALSVPPMREVQVAKTPSSPIQIAPIKLLGDTNTVTGDVLNSLFPSRSSIERKYAFDEDTHITILPIYPIPTQIQDLQLTPEEITQVTCLSFFHSGLSDQHLEAVVAKFPMITHLSLILCPDLTDSALSCIVNLQHIQSITIRFCPGLTMEGIASLPLERLRECTLSTKELIDPKILARLRDNKELQLLDLNFCDQLTPELLLILKDAKSHAINLSIKECPQITQEAIFALNQERLATPIQIKSGFADLVDRETSGLPRKFVPFLTIPDGPSVFSKATVVRLFPGSDPDALPNTHQLAGHFKRGNRYTSFNFSGRCNNDSFREIFSNCMIQDAQIYNCSEINRNGLISLRGAQALVKLHLGKLPHLDAKGIEDIFTKGSLINLEELYLSFLPVTDRALELIAQLPRLKKLVLAECHRFTARGLNAFQDDPTRGERTVKIYGNMSLDLLSIYAFQKSHRYVRLETSVPMDPQMTDLIIEEAERVMLDDQEKDQLISIEPFCHPGKSEEEFYVELLGQLGIEPPRYEKSEKAQEKAHCNHLVQAYLNLSRVAWIGLLDPMIQMGYFTMPGERVPSNVREIFEALDKNDQKRNPPVPIISKFKLLNLENTGITRLPGPILQRTWPTLQTINLGGTAVRNLPEFFLSQDRTTQETIHCPYLKVVRYSDRDVQFIAPELPKKDVEVTFVEVDDSKDEPSQSIHLFKPKDGMRSATPSPTAPVFRSIESGSDTSEGEEPTTPSFQVSAVELPPPQQPPQQSRGFLSKLFGRNKGNRPS